MEAIKRKGIIKNFAVGFLALLRADCREMLGIDRAVGADIRDLVSFAISVRTNLNAK